MAWYDFLNTKRQKPKKSGPITFSSRFNQLFLQRVGIVNSYDDDVRTYIERGYQENPVVYSIVDMVAKSAARAKWKIVNEMGEEMYSPLLKELMFQPNPLSSWSDLIRDAITHKLLQGNSFLTGEYGTGLNASKYNSLYILPSEDMQIIASNDFRSIRAYKVDFAWSTNTEIPATDVLHLKNSNPDFDETDNWLFGQSAFRAASRSIQTYNESLDTGVWFLANKGAQKILVNKNEEEELSPEARDEFKDYIRKTSQGSNNAGNLPIIDADLGVLDVSSKAKDALVLEQRKQAAMEICNVLGFPVFFLGINDSTYQNAKEASKALWSNVIIPELEQLKDGLNRWLAPQFGDNVYLDYDLGHIDALQEDKLTRGKSIKEYAGLITINQALELAGLPKHTWMKEPTNMEEFREQMYLGFTQAVVTDQEEISDVNNNDENNNNQEEE